MLKIGRGAQGSLRIDRTGAGDKGDLGLRSLYNEEAREPPAQSRRSVSIHRSEPRSPILKIIKKDRRNFTSVKFSRGYYACKAKKGIRVIGVGSSSKRKERGHGER